MTINQVHTGRYCWYGDYYRVWDVLTDETDQTKILSELWEKLYDGEVLPEKAEWSFNVGRDGPKYCDAGYYFRGYYTLSHIPGGYRFTICEPFAF